MRRHGPADLWSWRPFGSVLGLILLPEHGHELGLGLLPPERVAADGVLLLVRGCGLAGGRERTLGADDAGADAVCRVSEDEGADDVDDAKGDGEDSSSEYEAPEGEAELLGRVGGLVELPEDVAADEGHGEAQPGEAGFVRENGPCAAKVGLGDGKFGDGEEDGDVACEKERGGVEKEEAVGCVDLDDQGPARNGGGDERNEGNGAEDLEDYHPRSPDRVAFEHVRP